MVLATRLKAQFAHRGKAPISLALMAAILAVLLLYRLGTLAPGISPREAATLHSGISLGDMYHNPLNLPLQFLQWLCFGVWHSHSRWLLRLPDVILAAGAFAAFATLLRRWYGARTALFGAALFAFAPWFLHAARLGVVEAEQLFAIPMAMLALAQLNRHFDKPWHFYGSAVVLSLLLYVPGLVWFVGTGLLLQIRDVFDGLKHFGAWWQRLLYPVAWLLPLTLLIISFIHSSILWRPWLAFPAHFAAPLTILGRLGAAVAAFVWQAPLQPAMWLDRLPLLNVFSLAMVFVGIAFYAKHWLAPRTRLLVIFFLISLVLYALDGPATLSFAVPIVYSVAAAGVGYLLHQWLTVFPRNPLARWLGISLIVLTLAVSCLYNVRQYFVAWPHSPATTATFRRNE